MPNPTVPPARPDYDVREFKGMHAVFRGEKLVTRTADEEAAKAYAAAAEAAPADRKPKASILAPVETAD